MEKKKVYLKPEIDVRECEGKDFLLASDEYEDPENVLPVDDQNLFAPFPF